MARQPFFSGNYGSALGQIDTRPIMQGAAAQAAMYQGLGQNIGGAIEKYQLNKVKRAKLTGDIEAYLKENPDYINESTMTGDEAADKKNMTQFEKFAAGDLNMAGLEGLAGKLARGDTLRKNKLLEESQLMQNKMQKFNFGVQKELKDTKVNIEKDKGVLSRLFREREEEQDPAKRKLFDKQISETLANLGMGDLGRKVKTAELEGQLKTMPAEIEARKVTAEAVPGQVEDATATRKRKNEIADALFDASGGAAGMAKMSMEDRKLRKDQILLGMEGVRSQMKANQWSALAKFAPPTVKQQAADLAADQGRLLGLMLRDPITKGEITFKKYLELNNTEGDDQYPLTGAAAGTAATYHGRYVTGQRQLQELYDGVQVQANDTSGGAGAVDGTSASGLPSAIDPSMTPVQADAAKTARITEIRTLIDNLNTEFANLGAPGQSMTTYPVAGGMGGSAPTTAPQTVGYISQRRQQIPAEIAELRAELTQLANL